LFSAVLIAGFVAGLPWGIVGVAAIYAVLSFLLTIPSLAIPFRLIGLPLTALWKSVRLIVVGTAAMAAVVAALRWVLVYRLEAPAVATLGVCVVMGAAFYFLFMYNRRSAVFRDVLTLDEFLRITDEWDAPDTRRCELIEKRIKSGGRTAEEETGGGWVEGLHPDDRELCMETYLRAFHARWAAPDNCILAIYGDIQAEAVRSAVEAAFKTWRPTAGRLRPATERGRFSS